MKEYAMFIDKEGDIQLFCGGQWARQATRHGVVKNFGQLLADLAKAGEVIAEVRDTGTDPRSGEQTFVLRVRT